jgi:hypothetical protein
MEINKKISVKRLLFKLSLILNSGILFFLYIYSFGI